MEAPEEVVMGGGSSSCPKDLCQIVIKGKRTKRQRPQSPIPFTITTHSSSGDGGYGSNGDGDCIDNNNNNNNNNAIIVSSNNNSDEEFLTPIITAIPTQEDEDMAKCLILLAQGHHQTPENNKLIDQDHRENLGSDFKFTSKRYIETPVSANGKAGMYVYQCKTCGRTFPSFQALGGHRASHKKPKSMAAAAADERRMLLLTSSDDEDIELFKNNHSQNYHHGINRNNRMISSSSLTLELNTSKGAYNNTTTDSSRSSSTPNKVHECSYCGAEFTSGQALGGHMRRHRGAAISAITNTNTNTTLSLSPISPDSIDQETEDPVIEPKRPRRYSLSLDLNLPAPEDDHHHRDSTFAFASKQQTEQEKKEQENQTALVSTARRLIECQY